MSERITVLTKELILSQTHQTVAERVCEALKEENNKLKEEIASLTKKASKKEALTNQ